VFLLQGLDLLVKGCLFKYSAQFYGWDAVVILFGIFVLSWFV